MTEIDSRKFLTFFKSKTGQITAFGILFFICATFLTGVLYFRHGTATTTPVVEPNLDKTADKSQQPSSWFSGKPDADYANKHPAPLSEDGSPNKPPATPAALPISLYHGDEPGNGGVRYLRALWKDDSVRNGHHH